MELMVLGLFCTLLLASLIFHFSILIAMMGGLILFLSYGAFRGFSLRELTAMTLQGVRKAGNILLTLLMIGVLTAVWRAAGTISTIVSCSAGLLRPSVILLMSFLLNCLVSFLTGTSFGTGATMGVICGTIANAMGVPPVLSGGAILSGAFFGDRCSPVSTSMLLVSEITETDAYENIRTMFRTAFWPFVMTCLLYGALGLFCTGGGSVPDLKAVFSRELSLSPLTLIPAAVIIILSLAALTTLTSELDVLTLGEESASGLGMNTRAARIVFLLIASLLAGSAVSVAGLLSFVGLIVPHAVRRVSGSRSSGLIGLCALFGGGFVCLCDTAARTLFAPYEVPVGIIMAFLGAPFFVFILAKGKGGHSDA